MDNEIPGEDRLAFYIAGPMRGYEKYNFPAFDAARDRLNAAGYLAINPADLDRQIGVNENTDPLPANFLRGAMERDLSAVANADGIALLPGWQASTGANMEVALGRLLGLQFIDAETLLAYEFGAVPVNRGRLLEMHTDLCAKARALMVRKNHDYAGRSGETPFANFARVEAMGICSTAQGFLVRIIDKISRLSTFAEAGKLLVADEGVEDTLIDLINYSVLLAAYLRDAKAK